MTGRLGASRRAIGVDGEHVSVPKGFRTRWDGAQSALCGRW
jgi:hypothetical protein